MDLVDSTPLLLAIWLMGIVDLDIPRTTEQQQKYKKIVIVIAMKILRKYEEFSYGKCYVFTNQVVVPYNKYLLYKYDCHFNVEFCHSVQAIKYTLKYPYKGSDQVTVTIKDNA